MADVTFAPNASEALSSAHLAATGTFIQSGYWDEIVAALRREGWDVVGSDTVIVDETEHDLRAWWDGLNTEERFEAYRIEKSNADNMWESVKSGALTYEYRLARRIPLNDPHVLGHTCHHPGCTLV